MNNRYITIKDKLLDDLKASALSLSRRALRTLFCFHFCHKQTVYYLVSNILTKTKGQPSKFSNFGRNTFIVKVHQSVGPPYWSSAGGHPSRTL